MSFYVAIPDSEGDQDLRQGDILWPIPFLTFSITEAAVKLPSSPDAQLMNLSLNPKLEQEAVLLARVIMSYGIVSSQSCDLTGRSKRSKPIIVSRISPASAAGIDDNDPKAAINKIKQLAKPGQHPTTFYLPAYHSKNDEFKLPRSLVNLLDVVRLPPENRSAIIQSCLKLRLTKDALGAFQERIAFCFGRFAAPDNLYLSETERLVQKE